MIVELDQINELVIEATAYCNLHCPQCPRFNVDGYLLKDLNPGHLSTDNLQKNIRLESFPNLRLVRFEGDYGDIMMHPDPRALFDIFRTVESVVAITNGSLRSAKFWAGLAEYTNLTVTFSIDGLEDTNHIYRINSDYRQVLNNARAYISAGGRAVWKYIVFEHNEHQVESARQLSKELGFADFIVQHSQRSWFTGPVWAVKIDGEYQYDLKPSSQVAAESTVRPTAELVRTKVRNPDTVFKNCFPQSKKSLYINHLGHVLPCCLTSGLTWRKDIQSQLWRRIIGDLDSIDINLASMPDIIASDFYSTGLKDSFSSTRCHPTCIAFCS